MNLFLNKISFLVYLVVWKINNNGYCYIIFNLKILMSLKPKLIPKQIK